MQPSVMTRSLYVSSKDRQAEVAQRRKEREDRVNKEREEQIRLAKERARRALERKEEGLKVKATKNKQQEQERLKEIQRKRAENERKQLEKKKVMELKVCCSRVSPQRHSKTPIAFGSGVPRKLDFGPLAKPGITSSTGSTQVKQPDKRLPPRVLLISSVYSPSARARAKPEPRKADGLMTRSMYVASVSSPSRRKGNPLRNERPVPVIRRKSVDTSRTKVQVRKPAVVVENSSKLDNSDSGAGTSANASIESILLASSVHVPHVDNRDSDNESSGTVNLAMPSVNLERLVTVTPAIEQSFAEAVDDKHFSEESDATPLVSSKEEIGKKNVKCDIPRNPDDINEDDSEVVDVVEGIKLQLFLRENNGLLEPVRVEKKSESEVDVGTTDDIVAPQHPINTGDKKDSMEAACLKLENGKTDEVFEKEKPVNEMVKDANGSVQVQDQRPSINQLKQDIESGSGILEDMEIYDEPAIQGERPLNAFISRLGNNSSPNLEKPTEPRSGKPASPESLHHSDSTPTLRPLKGGAVLGLTEKLEQERLNRRQRLAEIMMKNRDCSASTTPVLAPPLNPMEGMDRIRELLDRRAKSSASMNNRQQNTPMHEGPAKPSLSVELQATSLAEELANLQLNSPAQVILPGQVPES